MKLIKVELVSVKFGSATDCTCKAEALASLTISGSKTQIKPTAIHPKFKLIK